MQSSRSDTETEKDSFLPDFCSLPMVFSVVVIGQLLAFILTLAPLHFEQQRWNDLAMISLYIQWNGLLCSAMLCLSRKWLNRLSNELAGVVSFLLLTLLITLIGLFTFAILDYLEVSDEIISTVSRWEFLLHNFLIGGMISALALRYYYVRYQWQRQIQAESKTRLSLLEARIRPHFLFNSMNTIASLTREDPEKAELVTENLAELFRVILRKDQGPITLKQELELCRRYMEIESLRFGERLHFSMECESLPDDALIPALTIQPLLENALFHGIENCTAGGEVNLAGKLEKNTLLFELTNPYSCDSTHRTGNRIAQENIQSRLEAYFGDLASMSTKIEGQQYRVLLRIPYTRCEAQQGSP